MVQRQAAWIAHQVRSQGDSTVHYSFEKQEMGKEAGRDGGVAPPRPLDCQAGRLPSRCSEPAASLPVPLFA